MSLPVLPRERRGVWILTLVAATEMGCTHPSGMHSCFARFCRKLHENERNSTEEGGSSLVPPLGSSVVIGNHSNPSLTLTHTCNHTSAMAQISPSAVESRRD